VEVVVQAPSVVVAVEGPSVEVAVEGPSVDGRQGGIQAAETEAPKSPQSRGKMRLDMDAPDVSWEGAVVLDVEGWTAHGGGVLCASPIACLTGWCCRSRGPAGRATEGRSRSQVEGADSTRRGGPLCGDAGC